MFRAGVDAYPFSSGLPKRREMPYDGAVTGGKEEMQAVTYASPAAFLAATEDRFRADEARYGLVYGIARMTVTQPHYYGEADPWFCTVGDKDNIGVAAWRTPSHPVGAAWLGGDVAAAVPILAAAVRKRWGDIEGFTGHREIADPFAEYWCRRYGAAVKTAMALTMYRLDAVNETRHVAGTLRLACEEDRELIARWSLGFNIDCFGEEGRTYPLIDADAAIKLGRLSIWDDNGPVCMVGKTRPTEKGMSIGPVYTPPERRGKGYATATTAAVCRGILADGKEFCVLYADRDNPASNAAYLKVGFRIIGDSVTYTFKKAG
jgi:predicted GNAT family acetyltransferase